MRTFHLFRNYLFVRTVAAPAEPSLLTALCEFQKSDATQELATFTALDPERGIAFSQEYRKTSPGMCWHGDMGKHERGIDNPGSTPSFNDLLTRATRPKIEEIPAQLLNECRESMRTEYPPNTRAALIYDPVGSHDGTTVRDWCFCPQDAARTLCRHGIVIAYMNPGGGVVGPDAVATPREWKATTSRPVTVYYCKAGVKTGETVKVEQGGDVFTCSGVLFSGVTGEMIHNNSRGKAKASGARCVFLATSGLIVQATKGGAQ